MDEKLKFVQEQSGIMDSFIDNSLQTLEETRQDVIKVQEYASKYGYTATEETTFTELTREILEANTIANQMSDKLTKSSFNTDPLQAVSAEVSDNTCDLKFDNEHNSMQDSEKSNNNMPCNDLKVAHVQDVQPGTPKLLEIGLSKTTLKQFGYTFKEDGDKHSKKDLQKEQQITTKTPSNANSPDDSPIPILKNTQRNNLPATNTAFPGEDSNITCDEPSITSDISILHAQIPNTSNTTIEMSRIEISPGLIVKRPSSKTKQKSNKNSETNAENNHSFKEENKPPIEPLSSKLIEPSTPGMKTIDDSSITSNQNMNDSPIMPTLQTMDIQKFLKGLGEKEPPIDLNCSSKSSSSKNDKVLHDKSLKCAVAKIESATKKASSQAGFDSPEIPVLQTMDLGKYLSNYNSSHGSSTSKSKEAIKNSIKDNTPEITMNTNNIENKTPDFPELSSLSQR